MKKHFHKVAVLFGILLLLLTSGIAAAQSPSIQFKLTYNAGLYEVWMKPTAVSSDYTLTSQVTIKVPHNAANGFTVNNLTSRVTGMLAGSIMLDCALNSAAIRAATASVDTSCRCRAGVRTGLPSRATRNLSPCGSTVAVE